jgi:hypothetical protein
MHIKKIIICLLIMFLAQTVKSEEIGKYKKELIVLGELDQKVRTEYVYWDDAIRIDKDNLSKLKFLINKHGFPTLSKVGKEGHMAAFLIAQHAVSDKEFMDYFRNEIKKRLGTKDVIDKNYAYLLDRTNKMSGFKQVYGTQGQCINGKYEISPVKDPKKLSTLRKQIGLLSLEQFSKKVCMISENG